jgi:hypothetical protein
MMPKKTTIYFLLTVLLVIFAQTRELSAQLPDYQKLAAQNPNNSSGMSLIIDHLERSGTNEPLEELVRWEKTGFPEFHDKNGNWHINIYEFRSSFVASLYYFINEYDAFGKGARYLRLIDEIKASDFTYQLVQSAHRFLSARELETEFYRLVKSEDAEERARAFVLGRTAAEGDKDIAFIYFKSLRTDPDFRVRINALAQIAMVRSRYQRDVALAGRDRLLNDPEKQVRAFGAVLVIQGADVQNRWTEEDTSMLLTDMLNSKDADTRKALAKTVAKLTTVNKELRINEDKWNEGPQEKFVDLIVVRENEFKRKLDGNELLEAWKEWWTPLIEKYMVKGGFQACG